MAVNAYNPNTAVQTCGQSFWYDNIQRSILANGELARLISEFGVLGVTSNPAIFEKAISGSGDYDAQIESLARGDASTRAIYEALAIADIQRAADLLEPIFVRTDGVDGYVSLEVSPELAHDADGTIAEARRLFKAVGRRNLMIKVPATPAGIPAIRTLIAEGIPVNVTLIFSLAAYEQVARAYIAGLQDRAARGRSTRVASVASFFVSRVDTLIDKLLAEKIAAVHDDAPRAHLESLRSRAAVANARLAYERWESIFAEREFAGLAQRGARAQRLLWASTSTKNPALRDTFYVEALIGRDTVNTLPPATLRAFRDHGVVESSLGQGSDEARGVLDALAVAGIDVDAAMQTLLNDGVRQFADAFGALLAGIDAKRRLLAVRGVADGVDAAAGYIGELIKLRAADRIWQRDSSFWTTQPEHMKIISRRLGWLSVAEAMLPHVAELVQFREDVKAMGITDAVVLGMGGSALAPEMFRGAFGLQEGGLLMHVLDGTEPSTVAALEKSIDLRRTLFIVSSKSGATPEVNAFYKYFRSRLDAIEYDTAGRHFVAVTDEGAMLQTLALEETFGRVFLNPTDIGGRFSALSYFGLLAAALQGVDVARLLERAVRMARWCRADSVANPGLWLGSLLGGMALNDRDKVTFLLSPRLRSFGPWVEHMLAESTGKQGRGLTVVLGEASHDASPRAIAALSEDRLFVSLRIAGEELDGRALTALRRAGRPVIELTLDDEYDLGGEIFRWEFAAATAGAVLGVDPFDEPNVEDGRVQTRRLLDEYEAEGVFACDQETRSANGQVSKFLRQATTGEYIAVHAYLPNSDAVAEQLEKLCAVVRERVGVPVTLGYGPRLLHSTGQLHKGGANNVVVLQLTCDPTHELLIAGEPFSFGTLIRAQALGDLLALQAHERRVMRLHLGVDVASGLKKVIKAVSGAARKAHVVEA
jgi:transaldolase/glucose-6-phosphate isomerase